MTDPKEIARHSKRNNNHCIIRFSKAMFWCLQQRDPFTFADFTHANPEFKTVSPYRVLGIWVRLEILEADQSERLKNHSRPVQYRSRWITKNRAEIEARYGCLRKRGGK